ncbi:unnamed protein product, partial [Mesorhabditis belari]|uniref:Uncharacterized protein n=1 Tax=Mesorhabditis belari TaxID=2138241 RepID=A0AAF3F375_9BILA
MFALFLQICVPFVTIAYPWTLFASLPIFGWILPQMLVNVSFFISSSHATASSCCILFLTGPYKDFLISLFSSRIVKRRGTMVSVPQRNSLTIRK